MANPSVSLTDEARDLMIVPGEISLTQEALRPNTLRMRNTAVKNYFIFATGRPVVWGNKPETLIEPVAYIRANPPTAKDLIGFIRWMHRTRKMSTQTASAYVSHINSLMRQAFDESPRSNGRVKAEMRAYKKLRPSTDHHSEPITLDVLAKMLPYAHAHLQLLFTLCYTFSLRGGEALRIRAEDVEFSVKHRVLLTIPFSKTSTLPVTLCQVLPSAKILGINALAALTHLKETTEGELFRCSYSHFGKQVKDIARRAGIENWQTISTHGFRTGRITDLVKAGVGDRDTMLVSRHRDIAMLQAYYRPDQHDTQADAAERVNQHYEGVNRA